MVAKVSKRANLLNIFALPFQQLAVSRLAELYQTLNMGNLVNTVNTLDKLKCFSKTRYTISTIYLKKKKKRCIVKMLGNILDVLFNWITLCISQSLGYFLHWLLLDQISFCIKNYVFESQIFFGLSNLNYLLVSKGDYGGNKWSSQILFAVLHEV